MIKRIIELSARNKWLVIALAAVAVALAVAAVRSIPLDAVPDLSDTQVIIYSRWDRSPDILEDQVTYPIVTSMLGAPRVKTIRGLTDFGFSYVYVIFEDGTDLYWARSRVLEYLSKIQARLPEGVKTEIGPDATGVGWVYEYALVDETGAHSSDQLRSYQDWFLRYQLQSVPGVAEVASVGGFVRQYQVTVDPNKLTAYQLGLSEVADAIRRSNSEVGGRLLEISGREYMVRGRGYIKKLDDISQIVVKTNENGTPVRIGDIGHLALGPDIRRGVTDLDGKGDVASGIVVMRQGENALNVIHAVKERIAELTPSLPAGMKIVTTYDRSDLIERAIWRRARRSPRSSLCCIVWSIIRCVPARSRRCSACALPCSLAIRQAVRPTKHRPKPNPGVTSLLELYRPPRSSILSLMSWNRQISPGGG